MPRLIKLLMPLLVTFFCVSQNPAQLNPDIARKRGLISNNVPQNVDAGARYLFYISGYIVAAGNTRPTSPKFGVYEYEKILETLKQNNFIVISEARKLSPEIEPYASRVAGQVRQLLNAGVPPQNITIVGASQGSWIAMLGQT
jgi:hypothetical protein